MIPASELALLNEPSDHHLDLRIAANQALERAKSFHVRIDDPIDRAVQKQKRIVANALVALGQGDESEVKRLLKLL